jgi:hypothetical protein
MLWVKTAHLRRADAAAMPENPAAPSNQLDDLSSAELHRRAVDLARSRHDAKFLWRLLEYTPAAETLSGRDEEAQADIEQFPVLVDDAVDRDGKLDEALRPVYLDYLRNAPADHADRETANYPHAPHRKGAGTT